MLLHLTNRNLNVSVQSLAVPLTDIEELNYLTALGIGFRDIQRDSDEEFVGIDLNGSPFHWTLIPRVNNDYLLRRLGKALVKAKGYASLQLL